LAILMVPAAEPSITTPIPDGPGFPNEPPSTWATRSDIALVSLITTMREIFSGVKMPNGFPHRLFLAIRNLRPVHVPVEKWEEINLPFIKSKQFNRLRL